MFEKFKLKNELNKAINEIIDNYDKYSDNDKSEVQKFCNEAINLANKLEHYDKKSFKNKLKEAFENAFGKKDEKK